MRKLLLIAGIGSLAVPTPWRFRALPRHSLGAVSEQHDSRVAGTVVGADALAP